MQSEYVPPDVMKLLSSLANSASQDNLYSNLVGELLSLPADQTLACLSNLAALPSDTPISKVIEIASVFLAHVSMTYLDVFFDHPPFAAYLDGDSTALLRRGAVQ